MRTSFAPLCLALMLVGCPEAAAPCPDGQVLVVATGECEAEVDGGSSDGGLDAGGGDAGPDAGAVDAGDDAAVDAGGCADLCTDQVCDLEANPPTCVDCLSFADCPTAAEPFCNDSNTCESCTEGSEDCAGRPATPACGAAGECVECDATHTENCESSESCNLVTNLCVPLVEAATCEPCTNNDQCTEDRRCMLTRYDDMPFTDGGFCLELPVAVPPARSCPVGYEDTELVPIEGGAPVPVCAPFETVGGGFLGTTCPALLEHPEGSFCGAPVVCHSAGEATEGVGSACSGAICSVPCTQDQHCLGGTECSGSALPPTLGTCDPF